MDAAAPGHLRASHADRERVIGMLEAAFAAGLITKDQFHLGASRALASRTYADLAAAAAGRGAEPSVAQPPTPPPTPPPSRPGNAAACGACGLVLTAFLTILIMPSGTTIGVVAVTALVVYASFWLLTGLSLLASRRGWLRLRGFAGAGRQRKSAALQCLVDLGG
jgi:Domain of unknown function (DUF1707)